ncbi:MAG TPA: AmmeMemoRadiSam system radical SAM enzyme [Draconibacterium sp.]|nr:AmmeMemoRadiSam system radical SAM enzyme [Draconibacterium sp.]
MDSIQPAAMEAILFHTFEETSCKMHEALFYTKLENQTLRCNLCPWNCTLKPGQTGNCKVRTNENGTLITHVFDKIAAFGIDPIEKKPLYHFYPGKNILSIGEVGCNLHCTFCQNHRISQCFASEFSGFQEITSKQLVAKAMKISENIGIAFTYNEPFTFYEFTFETARLTKEHELKNVVVSNGYINPEPLIKILPFIDAFNIDLKAFTDAFYRNQTKGKLEPVLTSLKLIAKSKAHLEITNLIIPGLNDDETQFEKMINWIASELGNDVPLHLSRFFPQHELNLPATSIKKLESLYDLAKQHLQHVYLGNVHDEKRSTTFCPDCCGLLIERNRYNSIVKGILPDKSCKFCGNKINIVL